MKALIQRVSSASVLVGDEQVSDINQGLLVFLGVYPADTSATAKALARKILSLRVFPGDGKDMNRSVVDIDGSILLVSQFTLCARTDKGNRPSFVDAADPSHADSLYQELAGILAQSVPTKTGRFGEFMRVSLVNSGPVTIMLEL